MLDDKTLPKGDVTVHGDRYQGIAAMELKSDVLVRRLRDREPEAMGQFFQLRREQLRVYVERNMGPALRRKVDPEDIVQEVGIECVRSIEIMDLAQRDPFSWMCQVAERRIVDAHRKFFNTQKRDAGLEVPLGSPGSQTEKGGLIDLLVASITSPSQAYSRDQRHQRLSQALAALPELTQEALRLRYVEGLASKEVARRLDKTDGAVRVMLTRAIKRLEELLRTG
jgi:RNA polymerase sigma-70 factor (ECF subfamily)